MIFRDTGGCKNKCLLPGYSIFYVLSNNLTIAWCDIPLIVITAGQFEVPENFGLSTEEAEQTMAVPRELQAELAASSSNGKQVIAEESGHQVHIDQPELVMDAVRQVIEATGR